jgi:hypothetical protein
MTDTLRCRCGGEVRVVRLNERLLGLGHVRNPRDKHHPVRLSRTTADRTSSAKGQAGLEDSRRSSRSVEPSSGAEVERVPPLRAPSVPLGARRP